MELHVYFSPISVCEAKHTHQEHTHRSDYTQLVDILFQFQLYRSPVNIHLTSLYLVSGILIFMHVKNEILLGLI